MRVIALRTLLDSCESHVHGREARQPVLAWHDEAKRATWKTPADVKAQYRNASVLKNNRVVFNIGGNKFRLVVKIHYDRGIAYVRFIGTHAEYDAVDANTI